MIRGRAADRDEPGVMRSVTGRASQRQIRRIVRSAVGAAHDVVDLESARGPTAGSLAAAAVAAPHEANHARWDVLMSALRVVTVERAEVLRLASGTFHRCSVDRDAARRRLPANPGHRARTRSARSETSRDRWARSPAFAYPQARRCTRLRSADHRRGGGRAPRRAESRAWRSRANVEGDSSNVTTRDSHRRIGRIGGKIAGRVSGDQLLDLAEGLAACLVERRLARSRASPSANSSRNCAENDSSPSASAVVSSGNVASRRATRNRCCAVRGAWPITRSR